MSSLILMKITKLTSCVLIDKVDGKIQKCKNTESFRTLWQLVGVWQIDNKKILENKLHDSKIKRTSSTVASILRRRRCLFCGKLFYFFSQGDGCSKHFQKLLGKNIQIVYNRQHTCPTLRECDPVCILTFEDVKNSRCICSKYYKLEGDYFYVKPGKGKVSVICVNQKYHDQDIKKNLEIIAHWLLYIKVNKEVEYQKRILETFLPLYFQCLNENYSDKINTSTINQIQSYHPLFYQKSLLFYSLNIDTFKSDSNLS
ncbi:hypothetical protein RhiirA4_472919 [Rhizophagus irregularis]|uniref:Uncharacterized protein n=1 Tax=Rhizophagus irregularis TaxID=588596 RepID=A0A2I1H5T2_9GLOM|nr:hypothetical protein RhiirA4_472919 [Rhizophagus irregularis]